MGAEVRTRAEIFEKNSGSFDKHMANEQNPHHYVFLLLHLALQDPSVDLSNVSWPLFATLPPSPSMPYASLAFPLSLQISS
jgi:hypothetical protein